VESVTQTEEECEVYNLFLGEDHTYFVGCDEWGFSVWAHNEYTAKTTQQVEADLEASGIPRSQAKQLAEIGAQKVIDGDQWVGELQKHAGNLSEAQWQTVTEYWSANVDQLQRLHPSGRPSAVHEPIILSEHELIGLRKQLHNGSEVVLKPNRTYQIDNAHYMTDDAGRLQSAKFSIDRAGVKTPNAPRTANSNDTTALGSKISGIADDVGFHLLGDKFFGAEYYPNLVPGNANLNRSAFRAIERLWQIAALKGHSVQVSIQLEYGASSNIRPTAFDIGFVVNGKAFQILLQNLPGQTVPRGFKKSVRSAL
jgi:hypothetical protein